jgi:hypothetical protein
VTAPDPLSPCGAKTRKGTPCKQRAGHGTGHPGEGRCSKHGGSSPRAEVAGQVVLAKREAMVMGVPLDIPATHGILECIRIAAGEVRYASDRIAELGADEVIGPLVSTVERPLKEEKGAESSTRTVTEVHRGAPDVHIWVRVRHEAMDALVRYETAALRAGIQERLVRIAEGEAQILAEAMKRLVIALGHQPSDPKVREAMRGSLTLIAGGQTG